MKKYLLVSLTILFAATFVWAQETPTDPAPAEPAVAAPAPAKPVTVAPAPAAPAVAAPAVAESALDIDAEATVSWGVDFGSRSDSTPWHGFNNEASWKVKFPLYKEANTTSTKSNVPVYGEIVLEKVSLDLLSERENSHAANGKTTWKFDGKVKGLKAKLAFYGAYLSVFDKPNFSANYAQIWEPREKDDDYDEKPFTFKGKFDGYGTKLGYANKDIMDLDVGLKFGSNGNWKPKEDKPEIDYTTAPTDIHNLAPVPPATSATPGKVPTDKIWVSKLDGTKKYYEDEEPDPGEYWEYDAKPVDTKNGVYGIGFDFSMKPLDKMLGVALTVNSVLHKNYDKKPNVNFGVKVTSEPIDGLALKAAFDGMYVFTKNFDWDTIFTAQYKWVGAGVYVGSAGTFIGKDPDTPTNPSMVDMAVFAQFETKGEKEDATNLVEGLDAGVYVGMYRLIRGAKGNKFPLFTKLWGAYTIHINDSMWIKPFADLWLETAGKDVALAYDLGVTFSPVEKVEVQAKWNQGTIKQNEYVSVIDASALGGGHYGTFVLSLTVKY